MSYEEEIGSRSERRRQLKVELGSDEDISKNHECHRNTISDNRCAGKQCLKNIRKFDISSSVNQDGGNRKDSEGTNLSVVYCRGGKVSHESKRERFVACRRNIFPKLSRKEEDKPQQSYIYHSLLLWRNVQSIEAIVSKIENNFKRVPPTALHKESKGVFRKVKRKKYKVFCPSKFDLFARKKKSQKIHEKHSQLNLEKCRIEKDIPGRHLPSYHSRKSNRIVNEIYRKYRRTNPITIRYSNIIDKIKENIRKFDHQYCSKHYQNKIYLGFDKKGRYSDFKEDLKFILLGLPQIRNEFIQVFPLYGASRNLDEFVEREINENQGSNDQETYCHSLNLEFVRLGSFHNFPSSSSVSTVKLARQGFYYSREEDTVICFACGFRKNDWKKEDDVETIHRAALPNCPLLNSNSTSNIQIGGSEGNDIDENSVSQNEGQQEIIGPFSNGSHIESEASVKNEGISRNVRDCLQSHSSNRPPSDQLTKARAQQEKINAFIRDLDPLGINFDRPKYPSYAVLAVRISSFTDWPSSITQIPRDLAIAGFLYAGYGDYTRCFFCGGGLRNWEPGDDPWTEHARWFPKCAFLRQNKGDEFVALVQIEHQEEAFGEMNGQNDDLANENITSQAQNSAQCVTTHPGFQSLLEMGYSSPTIQKAFDLLKETKESIDIKAEEILEIVLTEEETTGEDTLPPSASGGLEEKLTNAGKSKQLKTDTCKAMDSEEMNEGSDFHTQNQRDLNSVSQSLASMSVEETRSLIEENRKLKDLRLCKICLENEASIAMLPCGHLCCCPDCAPAMRKCPICRQFVKGTVKTWLV